jgi:hypothetical protein
LVFGRTRAGGSFLFQESLDADNWYDVDHVSSVVYTKEMTGAQVVFSDRYLVFPDGTVVNKEDPEDCHRVHVDTSCMSIFSSAFRSLSQWCLMPQELGPWCDRVMYSLLKSEFNCVWSEYKSVFFETYYAGHFMLAGLPVPDDAKRLPPLTIEDNQVVASHEFAMRSYNPCIIKIDEEKARSYHAILKEYES